MSPALLNTLAASLERPRLIIPQVVNHLSSTYGVTRDDVSAFLSSELGKHEDFEVDLILSPLFTPHLSDQAAVAEVLGDLSVDAPSISELIHDLVRRPIMASLQTADGSIVRLSLREVTVGRYVERLRLSGRISPAVFRLISEWTPVGQRPLLLAVARRGIWESESRSAILARYLERSAASGEYRDEDTEELLRRMEQYEPADLNDLIARLPVWREGLRREIERGGGPRPFFNERVEELHGGGRDQRRTVDARGMAKTRERECLERLEKRLTG